MSSNPKHVVLRGGNTVASLFDKFAEEVNKPEYTKSGESAINDDGEDKSTGITPMRFLVLEAMAIAKEPVSVADICEMLNNEYEYSSIRSAVYEMTVQGLCHLAAPPQPVVFGRPRPFTISRTGRAVVRNGELVGRSREKKNSTTKKQGRRAESRPSP